MLGGAVLWATAPFATSYVSSQAVVNAPLDTVLSPIDGRIFQRSPAVGAEVEPGQQLVIVEAGVRDRRYLEELQAQLDQTAARLAAIDAEIAELTALRRITEGRVGTYRKRMLERLDAEAREITAAISAAVAARTTTAADRRRAGALARHGYVSTARLETVDTMHTESVAEVQRLRARLAQVEVEIAAAGAGVFVRAGWNDVPYSQQRLDEIRLRLASLAGRRQRVEAERASLKERFVAERRRIADHDVFRPLASTAAVVWTDSGERGDTVMVGDLLMQTVDCDERFIELTLPERHFGAIAPGELAWVRLKGSDAEFKAPVSAVLGAGATFDHRHLAADIPEAKVGYLRVLVSLRDTAIERNQGAFCHVGRTAEVRIERPEIDPLESTVRRFVSRLGALLERVALTALGQEAGAATRHPG